jgi:type IV pilus assembly protein PilO
MTDTRKWSALAVVLIAAIFAASWFLLISPKRGEAADLRDQTVTQQEANARLQQQLQVLQAQQQDLPKQRAVLAKLRTQIPDNPALPSLIRDLTAAGRKVGVSLDTLAPAEPTAVVPPVPVAPVTTTETTDGGTEGASTDGATSTADAATAADTVAPMAPATTLFQVPLTMNVTGSYFELEQFLNKLEGLKRSLLVSGFTISEAKDSENVTEGDLTIVINGRVFVTQESVATPTTPVAPASTTPGQ